MRVMLNKGDARKGRSSVEKRLKEAFLREDRLKKGDAQ